jgi:Beta-fructosidases (levanase/invertase)
MPVEVNAPQINLQLSVDGQLIQEIDICLGISKGDYYVSMDVTEWMNKKLTITSDDREELPQIFSFWEGEPDNSYPYRPLLHYTSKFSWINDPNGLVYFDGWYHLYHQYNPYGVIWGNMHWGHVVSQDLIHWEQRPIALSPDENGTVYSGSSIVDTYNKLGYGKDTLLFFYTAAGGRNNWSKKLGNPFTQRLAYSTDKGATLIKTDQACVDYIINENRDPKVFFHEPTKAYIMPLYLDENDFAILRSADLLHWEEVQRLHLPGMWECPDLILLPVENEIEEKWIFWSADGYYVVGSFDGYKFSAESELLHAYSTGLPYAAQTYSGMEGRTVTIAWLRMKNQRGHYCGLMSLPMEMTLVRTVNGLRTKLTPVRELKKLHGDFKAIMKEGFAFNNKPAVIKINWKNSSAGKIILHIGKGIVEIDLDKEQLFLDTKEPEGCVSGITIGNRSGGSLLLYIDQEVIEFFGMDGTVYGAVETEENILGKSVSVRSEAKEAIMEWCSLNDRQEEA